MVNSLGLKGEQLNRQYQYIEFFLQRKAHDKRGYFKSFIKVLIIREELFMSLESESSVLYEICMVGLFHEHLYWDGLTVDPEVLARS